MGKKSTEEVAASSPTWDTLEAFARQSMQQLLQRMLEEEVDGYWRAADINGAPRSMGPSAIAMVLGSRGGSA